MENPVSVTLVKRKDELCVISESIAINEVLVSWSQFPKMKRYYRFAIRQGVLNVCEYYINTTLH